MRRADRLFRIVQLLRGQRRVTARYLAQKLEVSVRTIYRDMQDLSLSGVPVLGEAGSGFDRVVKTTIFLVDMEDFAAVNAVYGEYLGEPAPARSTVEVRRLPKDVRVEIEAVAYA